MTRPLRQALVAALGALLSLLMSAVAVAPAAAVNWTNGIDISPWQHPYGAGINWGLVSRAGYRFAYVKATEGNYYTNPYLAGDTRGAKRATLYAGVYHFAIPSVSDGASQARYFMARAGGMTLPPVVDLEWNPYDAYRPCYGFGRAGMVNWIRAFGTEVRRVSGRLPVIYTAAGWWNQCVGMSSAFKGYPLWVAAYNTSRPQMPAGWSSWTMWQYRGGGSVPGISGSVDADYFNGNLSQLADFAHGNRPV